MHKRTLIWMGRLSAAAILVLAPGLAARATAASTNTIVSLTFDDSLSDQLAAVPILDQYGFKGTFYVISGRVGGNGYMTLSNLQAIQADGHEIGGHTVDHLNLATLSDNQQQHEICDDRATQIGWGFYPITLAYPFGSFNSVTETVANNCGYTIARTVGGLDCSNNCANVETIPPQDFFAVKSPDSIKSTTTLADMQQYVINAEQAGGGWVPIVMHHICDGAGCDTLSISTTTLDGFLSWLQARAGQGTVVQTMSQVMGGIPVSRKPFITALSPNSVAAGNPGFTLTVSGVDFAANSIVQWNGAARATTFVNSTTLTAAIPFTDIASTTTVSVTVTKPGVGLSNPSDFSATPPTANGVINPSTSSIFGLTAPTSSSPDSNPVELGVKFQSEVPGYVRGIRFNKRIGSPGPHSGHLWTRSGALLASINFSAETASGWQEALFSSPVAVAANTTYIASYFASTGYEVNLTYFTSAPVDSPPLHALQDGVDGGNGVYGYGTNPKFPTASVNGSNYWVDVIFSSATVTPNPAPTLTSISPSTATVGDSGLILTANGSNFISASTLQWNGTSRATTFINGTTLTAVITSTDLANAGTGLVTVLNPGPGGGVTAPQTLTISLPPPPNPTSLPFTNVNQLQVQANWQANGNPSGTIYTAILSTGASPSSNGFTGNQSSFTANTFALFSGLSANTSYFVDVKAAGSSFISLGSTSTWANAPSPADFSNVLSTQITANWDSNGNPAGTLYTVLVSTDAGYSVFFSSVTRNVFATFSGLTPNSVYFAKVLATNFSGVSSNYVDLSSTATLVNAPALAAFSNVSAGQLQANWQTNGNPAGTNYTAIISTIVSPSTNNVAENVVLHVTQLFAIFPSLFPNTTYYVDVQAEDSSFISLGSTPTLANIPLLAQPSNIQTSQLTANWGANNNPAGTAYLVQISTSSGFNPLFNSSSTVATSATFGSLTPNTTYFTRVRAANYAGINSNFQTLPTTTTLAAVALAGAFTNIGNAQIQANWSSNGNPNGTIYTVVLSTGNSPSSNGFTGNFTSATLNSSALFPGLSANTTYFAEVKADGGSFVDLGSTATLANLPLFAAPTGVLEDQLTAHWNTNNNPAGTAYRAQISLNLAFSPATSSSTINSFATFASLSPNTTFYLRVEAINYSNISTGFVTLLSTITAAATPGASNFSGIGTTQLTANWTSGGNPAGTRYTVAISTDILFGISTTSTTLNTSVSFTTLSPNTTYYGRVLAINFGGALTGLTSLGSAQTDSTLPSASPFSNIGVTQVQANWGTNGNPSGTLYTAILSTGATPSLNGFPGNITFPTTDTSALFIGLSTNTIYYVDVQAPGSSFVSLGSTPTWASAPAPAPFSNVQAGQLTAQWNANGNPAGTRYTVQISTDDLFGTFSTSTTLNASAGFTGLTANSVYFARVRAINATGVVTAFTDLGSTTTLSVTPAAAAFSNVTALQLQANWQANGNPAGTNYTAIRSTGASPSSNGFAGNVPLFTTSLFAIFPSLSPNTTYFVDVQAEDSSFISLGSTPTLANLPLLAAPSNVQTTQLSVNWGPNNNPAGTNYLVQISTSINFGLPLTSSATVSTSATFNTLTPNTTYYSRAKAVNYSGISTSFTILPATVTLSALPGISAYSNVSSSQLRANWTSGGNSPGTTYYVQLSTDAGFSTIVASNTTSGLFTTFGSLTPATIYFAEVKAVNFAGNESNYVILGSTMTPANPPLASPFTNVGASQVQTNWSANNNPLGTIYTVILSSRPNPSGNSLSGNRSSATVNTSALFTTLSPNTSYFADVKADGGNFISLGSTVTWANVPGSGNPSVILSTQITANWTSGGNPNGTLYLAQISLDSGFSIIAGSTTTTNTTTVFGNLAPNTTYFMQVSAINQAGVVTAPTALPQVRTLPGAPTAAAFTNISSTGLQANWNPPANSTGNSYQAILSSGPNPSTNGLGLNQSSTTFNTFALFAGLNPNVAYYVDVKAINNTGSSSFAPLGSTVTWANVPGSGNPSVILSTQITANWTSGGNPVGTRYLAQISLDPGFASPTSTNTANLSAAFTGLAPNTTYYMQVSAINQAGVVTAPTALPQARTLPGAPTAAAFTNILSTGLQANWNPPANSTGNSYQAILSSGPNPSTNGLGLNQSSITFNSFALFAGLNPNVVYYVDVKAINNTGSSSFAPLGSTVTWANIPGSGNPTIILSTQITANWTSGGNPAGTRYLAQISLDPGFISPTSTNTANLSAAFTGLASNTTYYMQVSAVNQAGVVTLPVVLPPASTLPGAPNAAPFTAISTGSLQANWNMSGNSVGISYLTILSSAPNPSANGLALNQSSTTLNTFASFAGLNPNVVYYVDVKAINNTGSSSFASLGSTVTWAKAPGPNGPILSAQQIVVQWTTGGNPPGTEYLAESSLDSGFLPIRDSVTSTDTFTFFGNLVPNTTYYMRVSAINQAGIATIPTPLLTLKTLPAAPTGAPYTNVTPNSLQANWIPPVNSAASWYLAIMSTAPNPSINGLPLVQSSTTFNTFALFSGLNPNVVYYVDVRTINSSGPSVYASLGSTATLANAPGPASPSGILSTQITANWSNSGNAAGTVYRTVISSDSLFTTFTSSDTVNLSATFANLLPNTTYYMRVAAINQSGIVTSATDLPSVPTLANMPAALPYSNLQTNQVTANWDSNGNPIGTAYFAQISPDPSFFNNVTSSRTLNNAVTFSGLFPNTTYYMQVQAINYNNVATGFAALPQAITSANLPGSLNPSGILSTQITANWTPGGNPPGTIYRTQISSDSLFNTFTSSDTVNNSVTFTGLTPNTTYFTRVAALVSGSPGGNTYLPTALTLANTPIALPPSSVLSTQITAAWNSNSNPPGTLYIAQISADSKFNPVTSSSTFISSATFVGLFPNTTYYMQVEAVNAAGVHSGFVPLPTVTTLPNPPGFASFSGVIASQLQANWTSNGNPPLTNYQAILSTGNSPGTNGFSGNVPLTTTALFAIFPSLLPNTTYFVDVKDFNGTTSSAFTPLGSTITWANPPVSSAPSVVISTKITANWSSGNNPAGTIYRAQISTDPNFVGAISSTTANFAATFTGLIPNTTYFLQVQAFNAANTPTTFTPLPTVMTLANLPVAASPVVLSTQITANWTSGGNPAGTVYRAQISTDSNFVGAISSTTVNVSAAFVGLVPNTTYFTQVQAFNAANAPTSFVQLPIVMTLANLPVAASPVVLSTQITANWSSGGNPAGTIYRAQISTNPNFVGAISSTTVNLSAAFAGLVPNTTYFMQVQAFNAANTPTNFAPLATVITLANLPAAAAPIVQAMQITANWSAGGNPAGTVYKAQISINANFSGAISSATLNLSAAFFGLVPNTTYFMQVQAINAANAPTTFVQLPTAMTLANLPLAGSPVVLSTQITANWSSGGNPAGTVYKVQISTTGNFASAISSVTVNLSATFAGLIPNTTYFMQVQAFNAANAPTTFAPLPSALTLANAPLSAAPSNIQTNQITANWNANGNPLGTVYIAEISVDVNFNSGPSSTTFNTSAQFLGLLPDTTYYMRVHAINAGNIPTIPFTLLPSAETHENPPAAPGGSAFTGVSPSTIRANWTTSGNPTSTLYTVILSTGPFPSSNGFAANRSSTTLNTSVLFAGLFTNTIYYAEVNATTTGGVSSYTDLGSVSTLADQPTLSNPTNVQTGQITENWGAATNPANTIYFAEISDDGLFNNIIGSTFTANLSFTFSSLAPNTTHYAQVRALNQQNVPTNFTVLPSTITQPNFPGVNGFSDVNTDSLKANWTANGNPANITLYKAILSSGANPSTNGFGLNQTTWTFNTSVVFSGLLANTPYFVDIAATNSSSQSSFVHEGPIWTLANLPTAADPTNVLANQITAHWGSNGNPVGTFYLVQASPDQSFNQNVTSVSTTSLSGILQGLSGKTTYYMQVRAVNQNQIASDFIPLPSTTTLDNPAAPPGSLGLTNPTTSQLQANWTTNGNPAGTLYTANLSIAPSPSTNGLPDNRTFVGVTTSTIFSGLSPDTLFYGEVKATNSNGSSPYVPLGSVPTLANAPTVGDPTNVGANQLTANWGSNGNPADTLYLVQIGLSSSSFFDTEPTLETSFTFTALAPETLYYMQVRAINRAAHSTAFTILPSTKTVVGAPTGAVLTATQITDSSITWVWNFLPGLDGYHIISETGQFLHTSGPTETQWLENPLPVNTAISRSVVAFNASGASTSTLVTVFTLAHQPTGLAAKTVASNSITISWNPNGNPISTQYVARIVLGVGSSRDVTVTGLEATFDDLAGATTYFFTVQAINGAGTAADADNSLTVATLPQQFASGQICPAGANAIAFNGPNGQVRVEIPAGAFSSCIRMTVTIPRSFPNAPSSGTPMEGTGVGIQLDDDLLLQPLMPITLTIPFTSADVTHEQRGQLVLARYDEAHNAWVMLPSGVDPDQNVVTGKTDHLSLYQVMVALPAGDLGNVRIYPNPFRPALGHSVVNFVNLPTDASIQLFTLTGEKVQSLNSTATGTAVWDGRNQSGQNVSTGLYFAVIKSGSSKTILKVAVQR